MSVIAEGDPRHPTPARQVRARARENARRYDGRALATMAHTSEKEEKRERERDIFYAYESIVTAYRASCSVQVRAPGDRTRATMRKA